MRLLLANGVNVASRDIGGCTPLHRVMREHLAIRHSLKPMDGSYAERMERATRLQQTAAGILLEHDADPNARNNNRDTPAPLCGSLFQSGLFHKAARVALEEWGRPSASGLPPHEAVRLHHELTSSAQEDQEK